MKKGYTVFIGNDKGKIKSGLQIPQEYNCQVKWYNKNKGYNQSKDVAFIFIKSQIYPIHIDKIIILS